MHLYNCKHIYHRDVDNYKYLKISSNMFNYTASEYNFKT